MDPIFYSTVVGKFKGVIPDGVDPDAYPDLIVPSGSGTLTCSAQEIRITGNDPKILVPHPIQVILDSNGNLVPAFAPNTSLMVIAFNQYTNPARFTWRLDMKFTYASLTYRYGPHSFEPVSGGTVLLPESLSAITEKTSLVSRGPTGLSVYEMAVAQGKFTGTEQQFVDAYLSGGVGGGTANLTPDPNKPGFFIVAQ